jgi:lysophospholipase L1-like esterase
LLRRLRGFAAIELVRSCAVGLLVSGILIGVAELVSRSAVPKQLLAYRHLFASAVPMHLAIFRHPDGMFGIPAHPHEADDDLCWRNRRSFHREPYRTDSNGILSPKEIEHGASDEKYRLLILGDSSTAGLGLENHTEPWPQVLQRRFPDSLEVINAATIGYSSEQALRYLRREGKKYRPDGLAVYLGNNDPTGAAISDRDLLDSSRTRASRWARTLDSWLVERSVFYLVLKVGARFALIGRGQLDGEAIRTRRVGVDDFRRNLGGIVEWARRNGADIYLVTPPTPLEYPPTILEHGVRIAHDPSWIGRDACFDEGEESKDVLPAILATNETWARYPKYDFPIRKYANRTLACLDARLAQQRAELMSRLRTGRRDGLTYNNLGYAHAADGDLRKALSLTLKAIKQDPAEPVFHYNAGILYRRQGRPDAALGHLQEAIDLDASGTKIQSAYLAELRAIAVKQPGVVLIDANRFFRERNDEELFSDHVHPNRQGQEIIAELVAQALAPNL